MRLSIRSWVIEWKGLPLLLEVEQDSDAQTRFETTSKQFNDPHLSKVNTFGSGEDSMQLMELMTHCTKVSALVKRIENEAKT
ncbi:hypothetical protein Tco_0999044, partial [Tanacetum coccineum]